MPSTRPGPVPPSPSVLPSPSLPELLARCRPAPVVIDGVLPEICPALEQVILQRAQVTRSTKSLNVGGWKSTEDLFAWPDASVQALRQRLLLEMRAVRLVAWAMVHRAGSHHPRHQHRAAVLTGVYYVSVGSEDAITPTIFECEGDGREARYELEVEPHPGRLVISRGETWHRVPPYAGELPRVTIAFDLRR